MPPIASTQQYIDIAGIQDGVVILRSGGYRMILSISAINFSLKSEEEQNSLIFQYQSFLNSLHFPIQIVMRSKKLDLNPYIKKINEIKEKQENDLIRLQTEDYVDFISELINLANIMKKTFYVVVPYDPVVIKSGSILDKLFKKEATPANVRISDQEFKRYKEELAERANVVAGGLGAMGLHCVQLTTEEIIELFYKIYNPEVADKERFSNVDDLTGEFVADMREKKNQEQAKEETEAIEEESVIDNSEIVEEQKKKETQMKEREDQNQANRQIASTPPAQASSTQGTINTANASASTTPAPSAAVSAQQVVNSSAGVNQPATTVNSQNTSNPSGQNTSVAPPQP